MLAAVRLLSEATPRGPRRSLAVPAACVILVLLRSRVLPASSPAVAGVVGGVLLLGSRRPARVVSAMTAEG
ncbi:hypothetical protein QDR37_00610 [Amnibacterium sp. CER49]|uniref:hypothetical protein n=1 Tax=Amnibacterium sp. CER49 TaxID=3039161 RepID=UPI00244B0FEF|nr:hypothetical protein [Amnibacterium sp. CER49]MDH2442438.1 hypothetical protein [Amnibacterium sp. CER49]